MAYLNFLLSVPESQVRALRADRCELLRPSVVVGVSHLIAYWVKIEPLGGLLGQALDGGEQLSGQFRHPLRDPLVHTPDQTRSLCQKLADAWQDAEGPLSERDDWDWYRLEIGKVLRLFAHARGRGECVVSVLEPPADPERASRVQMPFVAPDVPRPVQDPEFTAVERADWPGRWALWALAGCGAGALAASAIGLCYWRYRRVTRRGG